MSSIIQDDDPRVALLQGGQRAWWDYLEQRFVSAATIYIPFGCPDWGETDGRKNGMCTFCDLPNAAINYREVFHGGEPISAEEHIMVFRATLRSLLENQDTHTLMVFNAGSFLAMDPELQRSIVQEVAGYRFIRRLVIESRAELITEAALHPLAAMLHASDIALTVRIGVETQDDHLRLSVLRKGHTRKQFQNAMDVLRRNNVAAGGYTLLNPGPGLDPIWAMDECAKTLDFILGADDGQLGMQEAYFCSTNVGGPLLRQEWEFGEFVPASLWMVYRVLTQGIKKYGTRIHLLPFKDEPPLLAVPSNHVLRGIPQDLSTAEGCDREFHAMLERYRGVMDPAVLVPPQCWCRPPWLLV